MFHQGEELGFSASLKPGLSSYVYAAGVGGAPFTPRASGQHCPPYSRHDANCLAHPSWLVRLTVRNSFLAQVSALLWHPHVRTSLRMLRPISTRARPLPAQTPPPAACVVITWSGRVLMSRGEGLRRRRKGGGGTRLVVLLPESRILSCCCRGAPSLPTMSHLVEPPPPLHNNNNNCEEGEQSLPPPAGLNSERGAAGFGGGMGEEEPFGRRRRRAGGEGAGADGSPIGRGRGCACDGQRRAPFRSSRSALARGLRSGR